MLNKDSILYWTKNRRWALIDTGRGDVRQPCLLDLSNNKRIWISEGADDIFFDSCDETNIEDPRFVFHRVKDSIRASFWLRPKNQIISHETIVDIPEADAAHIYIGGDSVPNVPCILYTPNSSRGAVIQAGVPTILCLHGGPKAQWYQDESPLAQRLAPLGIQTLFLNVRGSTGYGILHEQATHGAWGMKDAEDVWTVIHSLRSKGVPFAKIGLYGQSYGAYLALMASLRFKHSLGGVFAWGPMTDLHLLYKDSPSVRTLLNLHMGDPEKKCDQWKASSPATYVGQNKTRTLLIHGDKDEFIPISQSELFVSRAENHSQVQLECLNNWPHYPTEYHRLKEATDKICDFFEEML
jgi:dipeptidyl aminopeptidase/acylaminoacyl peptidase